MKNLFVGFLLFCFFSCSEFVIEESQCSIEEQNKKVMSEEGHRVAYADILTLTHGRNAKTRSASQSTSEIECLTSTLNDTLLYVEKKHDGGWIMYSSDTRVPAVVAYSETGSFDNLMQIDGARLWIQSVIEDMDVIKNLPDEKLNFSDGDIACNKAFWKSISSPDEYVKQNLSKAIIPPDKDLTPINGHYEFRYSESYSEAYDTVSRMMTTDWSQDEPYNKFCPLKSQGYGRALAGCVAIAGAQMLFYLHANLHVPTTAPSEAYCNGNIDSYTWDQTNYTSDIWDEIERDSTKAAPLIANVGKRLNMKYGNSSSSAYTKDLVKKVFLPYGISSIYAKYDTKILKNSLLNRMPVLISARSTYSTNEGIKDVGHAFIIDRYKRYRVVSKNYYEWVYDSRPSDKPVPMIPEKIEYTYSSPNICAIGINWGWGPSYDHPNEWFSLTGDWICSDPFMSSYNWNINRNMIYGFQVINN